LENDANSGVEGMDLDPHVDDPHNPGVEDVGADKVGVDLEIEEVVDRPMNQYS
jgi:hypothetical protein